MNETKCEFCGGDMVWVGGLADGRLECTTCAPLEDVAAAAAEPLETPVASMGPTDYDLASLLVDRATALSRDATLMQEVLPDGTVRVIPFEVWYMGKPTAGLPMPVPGCGCSACSALRMQAASTFKPQRKVHAGGFRKHCQCPECKQIRAKWMPSSMPWSDYDEKA